MPALHEIPGIGTDSLALLEATGIRDAEHLANQNPDDLLSALRESTEISGIDAPLPEKPTIQNWISAASGMIAELPPEIPTEAETAHISPVNYEGNPEVAEMLANAPYAIPLPGKLMMEKGLRVSDVPAGLLLNRYSGDLEVRIEDPIAPTVETSPPVSEIAAQKTPTRNNASRMPASKSGHEMDRVALIRAPLEKTNRGRNPESRRYIRGVLHSHPWSLRVGAFFSLLLLIVLPLAVVSAFLLLLSSEIPESFRWVPKWILAFPIALPLVGLGYLFWGFSGRCRICSQKVFAHKAALKHVKAHRLPGLGFVIPLCIHLLLFNWFRCSSCGTPVRLRK